MKNHRKNIGNKAAGLLWLNSQGFCVPSFSVIPASVQRECLVQGGFRNGLLGYSAKEICAAIDSLNINALAEEYSVGLQPAYSVRSSSLSEDRIKHSSAGRYKTVLYAEKNDLPTAIKEVWKSGYCMQSFCDNSDENSCDKACGAGDGKSQACGSMAVVIQEMCLGENSGVCFTRDPLSGASVFVVEIVEGACDALVSGEKVPQTFYFTPEELRDSRPINRSSPALQSCAKSGQQKKALQREQYECQYKAARQVALSLLDIEKLYGRPADIEFTMRGGTPVFLQIRPQTALPRYPYAVSRALLCAKLNDYRFYVKRDFAWLVASVQAAAGDKDYQAEHFFPLGLDGCVLANGAEYYSDEFIRRENEVFSRLYKSGGLWDYAQKIMGAYERVDRLCARLWAVDTGALSDTELQTLLSDFFEVYKLSYAFMLARPDTFLQEALAKELESIGQTDIAELIEKVSYCDRELLYLCEMSDFLLATAEFQNSAAAANGRAAHRYFRAHAQKYGWLNSPLASYSKPFSAKDYEERAKSCGLAQDSFLLWQQARAQRIDAKHKALNGLCGKSRELAKLLSEFRFLRTFTAENSDRLFYAARRTVLKEFAKRKGVSLARVLMSDFSEILAGKTADKKTAGKRKRGKLFVFEGGEVFVCAGKDCDIAESEYRRLFCTGQGGEEMHCADTDLWHDGKQAEKVFDGMAVCRGRVQGKIRVLKNSRDASLVQKGEVIVASMLTPDLAMCFFKAAGVITEEGGITCHAAIIAREYNTPCTTGVAGLLDEVKDGDTVVMDGGRIYIYPQKQ